MRRRSFVWKSLGVVAAGAVPAALVNACSEDPDEGGVTDPDGDGDDGQGDVVEVRLRVPGFVFDPANVTIAAGTTVRWVNDADTFHTVTPDGHEEWERWPTDSQGQSFEHTFETAGTFPYFCEPHRVLGMEGLIDVQ